MQGGDQHLQDKARLLLQRERELFDLRRRYEQLAVWLSVVQGLPEAFLSSGGNLDELWGRLRKLLLKKLRLQRVSLLELSDLIRPLAPAGPPQAFPPGVLELLEKERWGVCNDAGADAGSAAVAALANVVGLHRFMWSLIVQPRRPSLLLVGGFDATKAPFQPPFEATDAAHFNNASQHIQSMLANAVLVAELEEEKQQLRTANLTLEERDRALHEAAQQLQAANEDLERRVRERTLELVSKNRDLRLVLDNVDHALLTVDMEGHLAPERSRTFDQWFGPYSGRPLFVEHVAVDPDFGALFQFGLEAFCDGILPRELCLAQMPTRFVLGDRSFDCRYLPICEHDKLVGLLLVVHDVTERLLRAREDAEQREILAVFTALTRDRRGFLRFFEEADDLVAQLTKTDGDRAARKLLLHTLKGNAASYGLHVVADLCHQGESDLEKNFSVGSETLGQLRKRWAAIVDTIRTVVPIEMHRAIELSEQDLLRLQAQARQGASGSQIVSALERFGWEWIETSLNRLVQHAHVVADRLGNRALEVHVHAASIRLDPLRWGALWLTLVHMVRNAVDHGIETREQRRAAGKPATGRLDLSARRTDLELIVEIEDDGRGIDWDAVRRGCEKRGLSSSSPSDLLSALLSPEFSTCTQVTDTSGRGVGLAAVADVVRQLKGTIAVDSKPNQGTRWTLTFPETAAMEVGSPLRSLQ